MTKNPIINALAASFYIVATISVLFNLEKVFMIEEPNIIFPIMGLSFFVFSAAVMGYIFLAKPGELFLEGQKKEGVRLFLLTVLSFGVVSLGVLAGVLVIERMLG